MLREATYPPAAVNVLDDSSESMAAFQVFLYGRFWVFTEALWEVSESWAKEELAAAVSSTKRTAIGRRHIERSNLRSNLAEI